MDLELSPLGDAERPCVGPAHLHGDGVALGEHSHMMSALREDGGLAKSERLRECVSDKGSKLQNGCHM